VGSGTLALGAWSPVAGVLLLGVVALLGLTVAVVVLTAARSSDRRKQRNSAAVLDTLLRAVRKSPFES
jgi:CHASE1-domain containing sensor protein